MTQPSKRKDNALYEMTFEVQLGASSAKEAREALKKWIKDSGGIDKFVILKRIKL